MKRTNTQAQDERPQTSKGVRKKISQISKVESCRSEGKSIEIGKAKVSYLNKLVKKWINCAIVH